MSHRTMRAKMLIKNRLHRSVREQDPERVLDPLLARPAAHVEEVCGRAAGVLD